MRHLTLLATLCITLLSTHAYGIDMPGSAMKLVDEPCPQVGTITVSVDAQNVIRMNGRKISEEKFNIVFPQLAAMMKEICYSRAAPETYEPPPAALAVYEKIAASKVPVSLYWDLEFKKKVVFQAVK
jgi:hypothetical protein